MLPQEVAKVVRHTRGKEGTPREEKQEGPRPGHEAAGAARGGAPAGPRANARGMRVANAHGGRPLCTFLQGRRWLVVHWPTKTAAERNALENAPIRKHSDALNIYFVPSLMNTLLPVITMIYLPVNKDQGLLISSSQNERLLDESVSPAGSGWAMRTLVGTQTPTPKASRGRKRTRRAVRIRCGRESSGGCSRVGSGAPWSPCPGGGQRRADLRM